jgi:predicted DNA-binding transcriptional regulator AlpA
MPTEERLLNIKEAAEVLNVSTDWLYRDRRWETLPFTIVLSPRKIRFSLQGLLTWLKEQQHGRQGIQAGEHVSHSIQS